MSTRRVPLPSPRTTIDQPALAANVCRHRGYHTGRQPRRHPIEVMS
ncbi:hypothetical protein MicB006_6300 [Micromonospora sp. B006]|nr:hypothetical protein MicB006_6300 [Micromonospora sp. B006]